jgi:hypothetical protein
MSEKIDKKTVEESLLWLKKKSSRNIENRKILMIFEYLLQQVDDLNEKLTPRRPGRPSKNEEDKVIKND